MAHGKRFRMQYSKVQRDSLYAPAEAIALIKETASAKFDETIEVAMNLGVDPRHSDQMVRGVVTLPNGSGRSVRQRSNANAQRGLNEPPGGIAESRGIEPGI